MMRRMTIPFVPDGISEAKKRGRPVLVRPPRRAVAISG
jgi:hypothetical protein